MLPHPHRPLPNAAPQPHQMRVAPGKLQRGYSQLPPATGPTSPHLVRTSRSKADVRTVCGSDVPQRIHAWETFHARLGESSLSRHPRWLAVLANGLKHEPYCLEATAGGQVVGLLPLAHVHSLLFGRFLVGLPYLNTGGVLTNDESIAGALIDCAVRLAGELNVRYLELRHQQPVRHPSLQHELTSKVHMRLELPSTSDELWKTFKPKVRNQVRKGQRQEFTIHWGGEELLKDFYAVFSRNMRDLGTPVFGRRLFQSILSQFSNSAELCVARSGRHPIASGLLVHGDGVTDVPSASSLRSYNSTNANMFMYWHLLQRAIERGQAVFDFGRSSTASSTFRFKKQWGAQPESAVWQYYVRRGDVGEMRRENGKYAHLVNIWRRLPVAVTRVIGPAIVRGIP